MLTPSHPVKALLSVLLHPPGSPPPLSVSIMGQVISFCLSLAFRVKVGVCSNVQMKDLTTVFDINYQFENITMTSECDISGHTFVFITPRV